MLDFQKVRDKERLAAKALFKTEEGKQQLKEIKSRAKTFVPGEPLAEGGNQPVGRPATNASGLTPSQVRNIKAAIAKAGSLEEIERLNHMLRTGQIPGEEIDQRNGNNPNGKKTALTRDVKDYIDSLALVGILLDS